MKVTATRLKTEQDRLQSLRSGLRHGDGDGDDDYASESFDMEEGEGEEEEGQVQDKDKGSVRNKTGDNGLKSIRDKDQSSNKMRRQMREMVMHAITHVTATIADNTGARARTGMGKRHSSRGRVNLFITRP